MLADTRRPSLEEMESQATFIGFVDDGQLKPGITVANTTMWERLKQKFVEGWGEEPPDNWPFVDDLNSLNQTHEIVEGVVVLQNFTEISYTLPPNTTLVQVLGPVKLDDSWTDTAVCWAALDPQPDWWHPANIPVSRSRKEQNSENRTMFIIPVDPTVNTTLKVGSGIRANEACRVSGIKAYPFH